MGEEQKALTDREVVELKQVYNILMKDLKK